MNKKPQRIKFSLTVFTRTFWNVLAVIAVCSGLFIKNAHATLPFQLADLSCSSEFAEQQALEDLLRFREFVINNQPLRAKTELGKLSHFQHPLYLLHLLWAAPLVNLHYQTPGSAELENALWHEIRLRQRAYFQSGTTAQRENSKWKNLMAAATWRQSFRLGRSNAYVVYLALEKRIAIPWPIFPINGRVFDSVDISKAYDAYRLAHPTDKELKAGKPASKGSLFDDLTGGGDVRNLIEETPESVRATHFLTSVWLTLHDASRAPWTAPFMKEAAEKLVNSLVPLFYKKRRTLAVSFVEEAYGHELSLSDELLLRELQNLVLMDEPETIEQILERLPVQVIELITRPVHTRDLKTFGRSLQQIIWESGSVRLERLLDAFPRDARERNLYKLARRRNLGEGAEAIVEGFYRPEFWEATLNAASALESYEFLGLVTPQKARSTSRAP